MAMCLFLVVFWCASPLRAILRFNFRFGVFNSRLGAKTFPFSRQREFGGNGLIRLIVFSAKTALFGHNRKNSRLYGNNREFGCAVRRAPDATIPCGAGSAPR